MVLAGSVPAGRHRRTSDGETEIDMKYVATINTPGYLPEGDAVVFDTAAEAWSYLADELRRTEDDMFEEGDDDAFSETVDELDAKAQAGSGEGVVYGDTPGYKGDHDLGKAYCVSLVSDEDAAEIEALRD
jgi:hypothetical protein